MKALFAALHIPDFPLAALARLAPELRDKAVAVLDGTPPVLNVIAANARARAFGVEPGMAKVHAEACVGVHLQRRSLEQEAAAHAALLDCAHAFSPRVEDTIARLNPELRAGRPHDTVLLGVGGMERLLGSPAKIARKLSMSVKKIGLEAHVAIAAHPDAAMYAARGFSGCTVIPEGEEAQALGALPVSLLEPSPEILETLSRWGIRDFRGLATLPTIALSQRLGQQGLRLQRLAQGRTTRVLVPAEAPAKFEESLELEDVVELLEPLAFILNRLLEAICARLESRALAANALHVALELTAHEDATRQQQEEARRTHRRTLNFPVPMKDSRTLLRLVQLDLDAHPPGAPVKKISLQAIPAPPRFGQAALFVPQGPEPERLELTLARIRAIAGEDRVGSPELLDTHAPDAFRMKPFRPPEAPPHRHHPERNEQSPSRQAKRSALRIFRPPLEARVKTKQGAPVQLFVRGMALDVMIASGPWRHAGGWWTPAMWTREEWDLELRAQAEASGDPPNPLLLRVYRDLGSSKWFVESSQD